MTFNPDFTEDITVHTRRKDGTLHVLLVEEIDDEDLQEHAELIAVEHPDDIDMEEFKASRVQDAAQEVLKTEVPEAFDPQTPTRVHVKSDYKIRL